VKKLTVMVSIYNSGEWIQNRLENLSECKNIDMEVWCVNADSPDKRDHDIPQKFPFKYVRLPKRNAVYEAWNYIIENSNSQYITNGNTDDIVSPDCYEKLSKTLDSGPDFAYCSWNTTALANQKWESQKQIDHSGKPGHYSGDINIGGVGHFPMWKRSLHSKFGLFDTKFKALADADWWARCYHVGKAKFQWVDVNLATYLWRDGDNLWNRSISSEEWECYYRKVQEYKEI